MVKVSNFLIYTNIALSRTMKKDIECQYTIMALNPMEHVYLQMIAQMYETRDATINR